MKQSRHWLKEYSASAFRLTFDGIHRARSSSLFSFGAMSTNEENSVAQSPPSENTVGVGSAVKSPEKKFSPLSHLTAQSARIGFWEVVIFNPRATKRKYLYGKEERTSFSFQCMLVSTTDPSQYILGHSHGKGMTEEKLSYLEKNVQAWLSVFNEQGRVRR